ncbi:FAD-dependent oxidoreductase [Tenacibaculum halocynthiae]|uniref:FAD-dependent oxidoreductase n=1 Tax=Tenacibaculum halocynthiae TaxID=1254437 RepID=UPI003D655FEB
MESKKTYWSVCKECKGEGRKKLKISEKTKLRYQKALEKHEKSKEETTAPSPPRNGISLCANCTGSGLTSAANRPIADKESYPRIAIIGGGIGGVALAVACLHRKIPFTLYERDSSFDTRSQGYGLTLQQASKAIQGFGITSLKKGLVSTKHVVHKTNGEIIGEWGAKKWLATDTKKNTKRTNVHISRQSLRLELLEQLNSYNTVQWNHQLIDFKESENNGVQLNFNVNGEVKNVTTDLVVGADGIRSTIRKKLIGEKKTPLRYLGCIVILGICPLKDLENLNSPLLDSFTVFQTANGIERIYMMPYDKDTIMWQLSFPMTEKDAIKLSKEGRQALKEEACRRTQWHHPIPQILATTHESKISGYPVYDRELLTPDLLEKGKQITLIGDAAHPMSPFKGQGANQALLDALSLARKIFKHCGPLSKWKEIGIRKSVLTAFELEMLTRSASKVKGSAAAASFLHSDIVLQKGNKTRGSFLKEKKAQ